MADHSKSKKKKQKTNNEFEFCKVCKLNHDQGRSHKYFPNHKKSLSAFLSRFQAKLSDVRFFLNSPGFLRPEHAFQNRLWCVFCDSDIDELGSSFARANAINHLASLDHLKNLKGFLWKTGGDIERVDSFRISDKDLAKWEKKCESLKREAAIEECQGPLYGPVNDIHNELDSEYIDSFHKNNIHSLYSNISNGVVPLQNYTNERFQILHTETSRISEVHSLLHEVIPNLGSSVQVKPKWSSKDINGEYLGGTYLSNKEMQQVHHSEGTTNGESSYLGLQDLAPIFSVAREGVEGNVHSGAIPPWFGTTELSQLDVKLRSGIGTNKSGKSKLNPKRVGAAWADRRKIELEMEKRGELVASNYDANWLPNFGRVWQSGSRKESIKEFQVENKRSLKVESQPEKIPIEEFQVHNKRSLEDESEPEKPVQLQPYISKRMVSLAKESREQFQVDSKTVEIGSPTEKPIQLQPYTSKQMVSLTKESREEFQVKNKRSTEVGSPSEKPVQLQPYISKRMRKDATG